MTGYIFLTSKSCFVGCHWCQGVGTGSWIKVTNWSFLIFNNLGITYLTPFAASVLRCPVVDAETVIPYVVSVLILTRQSCFIFHYIQNEKIKFRDHCKSKRPRMRPYNCTRFSCLAWVSWLAAILISAAQSWWTQKCCWSFICSVEVSRYLCSALWNWEIGCVCLFFCFLLSEWILSVDEQNQAFYQSFQGVTMKRTC